MNKFEWKQSERTTCPKCGSTDWKQIERSRKNVFFSSLIALPILILLGFFIPFLWLAAVPCAIVLVGSPFLDFPIYRRCKNCKKQWKVLRNSKQKAEAN